MNYAFSTLGCEEFEWDDVVALARRHGITQIEPRALGDTVDLPVYLQGRFGSPAAWAEAVADAGVSIVVLDASCRLFADDPESEAELLALAPWAEAVGCRYIRIFDGGETFDQATLELGARRWAWWCEQRERHGWQVDLIIETHDVTVSSKEIKALREALPNPPQILWDTFLTWARGKEDPADTWREIAESVVHIHVKDGYVGGEGGEFTLTLPGDGKYPMDSFRNAMAGSSFAGAISLEWARKWHRYLPPLEDALNVAAERKWW